MATGNPQVPTSAVYISIMVVIVVLVAFLIIAGAYLIALHAVDVNNATSHALILREQASQLRAAVPTCQALDSLSKDSLAILHLPGVANAPKSAQPLIAFFQDFPKVFKSSDCSAVLRFAAKNGIK